MSIAARISIALRNYLINRTGIVASASTASSVASTPMTTPVASSMAAVAVIFVVNVLVYSMGVMVHLDFEWYMDDVLFVAVKFHGKKERSINCDLDLSLGEAAKRA